MGVFTKLCIISILLSTFLTLCDILQLARGEDELFAHPGLLWNIVKYRALLRNISLLHATCPGIWISNFTLMKHRGYRPSREIGIPPQNFASHKFMLGGKLISSRIFRYNQHTLYQVQTQKTDPITLLSCHNKTLPKAQQPDGWVLITKVTSLGHITSSLQILIKFHLHNLDQESTSKSQPNISI